MEQSSEWSSTLPYASVLLLLKREPSSQHRQPLLLVYILVVNAISFIVFFLLFFIVSASRICKRFLLLFLFMVFVLLIWVFYYAWGFEFVSIFVLLCHYMLLNDTNVGDVAYIHIYIYIYIYIYYRTLHSYKLFWAVFHLFPQRWRTLNIQSRETIGQENHVTCLKLRPRVNSSHAFLSHLQDAYFL